VRLRHAEPSTAPHARPVLEGAALFRSPERVRGETLLSHNVGAVRFHNIQLLLFHRLLLACRKSRLRSLLGADGKPEPLIRARRAPIERMLHCLFAGAPPTFVTLRLKQDRPGSLTEPEVRSRSRSPSNPTRLPRLACSPTLAALDRIRGLVCACRSIAWSTSSGAPLRCLLSVCGCHAGATPVRSLTSHCSQLAPLLHRDQCDALPYPRLT
jgi:hypothetical protein